MTRHVTLTLGTTTTDTHCGNCPAHGIDDSGPWKSYHPECAYGLGATMGPGGYVPGQPETWPLSDGTTTLRGAKCLASEQDGGM